MIKIVAVAQIENRRLDFDEEGRVWEGSLVYKDEDIHDKHPVVWWRLVPQVFAKGDLVLGERDTEGTSVKAPGPA